METPLDTPSEETNRPFGGAQKPAGFVKTTAKTSTACSRDLLRFKMVVPPGGLHDFAFEDNSSRRFKIESCDGPVTTSYGSGLR